MKSKEQLINESARMIDDLAHDALKRGEIAVYVRALELIRAEAASIARLTSMTSEVI